MKFFRNPKLEMDQVLALYESVGWTNYTQKPDMLEKALANSLYVLAAYDEERLIGFLRAVGDGASILFIQDILILPAYQRQGIGCELVQQTLEEFSDVYQIHLLTDQTEKTATFYQSLGFVPVENQSCRAFTYIKSH